MANTVGVRFRQAGKIFYYDAGDFEVTTGSYVVVETSHGNAVGRVVITPDQVIANESSTAEEPKPVLRIATDADIEKWDEASKRAAEAVLQAKSRVAEHGVDMSIANGEFDLDGTQFTGYFTANERVDFRGLVRDLSRDLNARVQLLQVGDRDRAKLTDGFDICGERLCCSSWMTNFPSVSIRMAKEQDLPLNPQKISGVCGRLYCCLTFEYEDYKALRGTLPKVGSMLSTPAGEAKVTGIDFNNEMVKLWLTEQHMQVEVAAIDFQLQHGVTVRPMELVRRIEGELRPLFEDSTQTIIPQSPGGRLPRQRPERAPRGGGGEQQQRGTTAQPQRGGGAQQQGTAGSSESRSTGGRERGRGRGRGPRAEEPAATPQASKPPREPRQPRPQQPPRAQPTPQPSAELAGDQQRKRRRRRRGRGGGGGESPASE
ncbi:MAG: stage 0 sporulation family protein [Dehalococcoidia bacterium]